MKKQKTNLIFVITFIFVFVSTLITMFSLKPRNSFAVTAENFRAGNIISDFTMENYTSMTEADIQSFLTSKNSCSNADYNLYLQQSSAYPNIKWHFDNGHFICLSEELFGDGETVGSGDTAAHIIWQAAQDYHINPQVLLVLLEKEQGLISDTWPNSVQYRSATGFGCPDTAPCSEKYYGFKNQIRQAANLFRSVLDGGWTNYPLGENYIRYNPNADCGGSIVNVENLATSALYRYTPYQPNAAALAAGYGTAPCGAYGNRNFYLYFMENFGDPTHIEKVLTIEEAQKDIKEIQVEKSDLNFSLETYHEKFDWLNSVSAGEVSGTTGHGLRLEAMKIKLDNNIEGDIFYRAHVESIGWQDWVKNGETAGTTGRSLRLEAMEIKLSDELSKFYDISYRAHVENIGWQDWVKNGETAGTTGRSLRVEAIQVKITKKEGVLPELEIAYQSHVQLRDWMGWVSAGEVSGTTGHGLRLEAMKIKLDNNIEGDIFYRAHVESIGWQDWVKNGETAGTTGRSLRLEAMEIKLSDELSKFYDISYRAHVENIGWQDWVKNGETAGTTGRSLRLEAIEIQLIKK